ncbi:MAG: hypothetical protein JSW71_14050 [Gemmatimonadota bacterium]|nr:MAG: hypothetical protein JSW71_14050 [Gemmatimonadota bacterium]
MSRLVALCCAGLIVGCAPSEEEPAMEEAAEPTIALADVAGTWSMEALTEAGDSVLVTYEMVATDNTEGWTITFPGRDPIPGRVISVEGDSIVVEAGPYESALRDGIMVTTRSVVRLQEGSVVGMFVAHYETTEPDSVLRGQQRGTRQQ